MATDQNVDVITLPRGADFTGDLFEVVKLNTSGQVILTAAATDIPCGVIYEAPSATVTGVGKATPPTGSAATIATLKNGSIVKMKAGAAITAGQVVVLDGTAGRVAGVAAVANRHGRQLHAGPWRSTRLPTAISFLCTY